MWYYAAVLGLLPLVQSINIVDFDTCNIPYSKYNAMSLPLRQRDSRGSIWRMTGVASQSLHRIFPFECLG